VTKLDQIKAALKAATPGPWEVGRPGPNKCPTVGTHRGMMIAMVCYDDEHPHQEFVNAHLIANAPEYIAWLVEQVEEAREEAEGWRDASHCQHSTSLDPKKKLPWEQES
jgi:hypothetical protein